MLLVLTTLLVMFAGQTVVVGMVNAADVSHGPGIRTAGKYTCAINAAACPESALCTGGDGRRSRRCSGREVAARKQGLLTRIGSMLRKAKPPPPPPPVPSRDGAYAYAFAAATAAIYAYLLATTTGLLRRPMVRPETIWLIFPLSQAYLHLAQCGLAPWIGADFVSHDPASDAWQVSSTCLFGVFTLLSAQGLMFTVICKVGPKSAMAHVLYPPMAIYAIAWSYYARKRFGSTLRVETDVFGLSFFPLHLVMWMASTATQCILWTQIYRTQCLGGVRAAFELPAEPLLVSFTMFWAGLLGFLDYSGSVHPPALATATNALLFTICCVNFYVLLVISSRPLRLAAKHYARIEQDGGTTRLGVASATMLRWKFCVANRYVWVTWHLYPWVVALGACGLFDGETREYLFTLCDVAAKFLPVSVYFTLVDHRE